MDSVRFVTNEAHSGNKALELRVAKYCDFTYGGDVKPVKFDTDSFADQRIMFTAAPSKISFYYKWMPSSGDYVMLDILLESENGNTLADTFVKFQAEKTAWTLANIPFNYSSIETPVYMTMKLKIAGDSIAHYGSRFLMDDFNTENITGINDLKDHDPASLKCFPVPAKDKLSVSLSRSGSLLNGSLNIIDAMGRIVQRQDVKANRYVLDIASLKPGVYCLVYTSGSNTTNCRFTKE